VKIFRGTAGFFTLSAMGKPGNPCKKRAIRARGADFPAIFTELSELSYFTRKGREFV